MLGDRLFLDRKLFKFSFSSDDLGGIQSTHVELKSCRDLAINGQESWGTSRSGRRVWDLGSSKSLGEGVPSGVTGRCGSYFLPPRARASGHLVASDDLLCRGSSLRGRGWATVARVEAAGVYV